MDFRKLIQTGDGFAQVEFTCRSSPSAGMMAWLDSREIMSWWRAETAIIEPYPGGRFYITWEKGEHDHHAICGVMETVDTENNRIEISQIIYLSPAGKLGPIKLTIEFEEIAPGQTKFRLRHTHSHKGRLNFLYNELVQKAWPPSFALFRRFVESRVTVK